MKYGEGVTHCKRHQITVYPDAGPKWIKAFHDEHKDCDGQSLEDRIAELKAENAKLKAGIDAVHALIDESEGVYGLHLNGDGALWGDLLSGGRFEEWLCEFSKALGEGE